MQLIIWRIHVRHKNCFAVLDVSCWLYCLPGNLLYRQPQQWVFFIQQECNWRPPLFPTFRCEQTPTKIFLLKRFQYNTAPDSILVIHTQWFQFERHKTSWFFAISGSSAWATPFSNSWIRNCPFMIYTRYLYSKRYTITSHSLLYNGMCHYVYYIKLVTTSTISKIKVLVFPIN